MNRENYRRYLIGVLLSILAFNYVDRQVLGLVLQNIKVDLNLSDTQLGLLTGIAFALFYSVMGIPIARWADRGNRIAIISLTTALWSLAVALSGLAYSFGQLLLIRIVVGVGEAGCIPSAQSLISDHFSPQERSQAMARYMVGGPLSVIVGYFLAGWLTEFYGWRTTFVLVAIPGIGLAALAWLTLAEPRRAVPIADRVQPRPSVSAVRSQQLTLKEVWAILWPNATFRHLLLGFSVAAFFGWGIGQWLPAFFVRTYDLPTGKLGTWLAVIYGLGGVVGTYAGGELAARYAAGDERAQLKWIAFAYVFLGLVSACAYISPSYQVALAFIWLAVTGGSIVFGPLFAIIQALVPDHMRAVSVAILYLFANLVGMGLGPLLAGALSDAFHQWLGDQSLRYSLLALSPGYLWVGWHFLRASTTVASDLEAVRVR